MPRQSDDVQNTVGTPDQTPGGDPACQRLVLKLRRALPKMLADQPVSLAYLYGSVAAGLTTRFSDTDIALVTDQDLSPRERLDLMLRSQLALADCCDVVNADVRIINDAPLVFRGRVVCDGILLYARSEDVRIEFETSTRLRYFDYLPIHRRLQEAYFAHIRERGLYGRS